MYSVTEWIWDVIALRPDLERKTLVLYRKRIGEGMYVNTVLWRAFDKAV